jgi:hypothetical protein
MTFDPRFARPALALTEQPVSKPKHSPAARAFQIQLTRIEKIQSQLSDMQAWAQVHRVAMSEQVHPLRKDHSAQLRQMALLIDQRLAGKGLSAPMRQTAVAVLCGIARTLAEQGDAEMAKLHDRHADLGLAQAKAIKAQAMRAQLEEALGGPIDDLPPGASAEEIVAVGMARLRQQMDDEKEQRREKAASKKAKKKPGALQEKAHGEKADASALLRALFRQLASALHPDRETDTQARERKTALMSEANAAYARKDLVTLLHLQQTAALIEPGARATWADDKLAAMTVLLKQQVADLERERAGRQDALAHEFDVPQGFGVTPNSLQAVLNEQVYELEEALRLMQDDLECLRADAGFKRWLKQQQAAARRLAAW